jgi:hypothetical protein
VFGRGCVGAGVLVYDLPLSMFVESSRVVSIMRVWVPCPYSWVRVVFKVLWMFDASSCVIAFKFATKYMCNEMKYIPYNKGALRTSFPQWGVTVL